MSGSNEKQTDSENFILALLVYPDRFKYLCVYQNAYYYMNDKLTKAKYIEWQASLFGACFIAFGLGILFASFMGAFVYIIILIGIVMHSWGMYKMHQRNK